MDLPANPVKLGTQVVLIVGFGGLLAMMALAGMDSINVLMQIQARNQEIRQNFLMKNRTLERIRASLYLSGARVQDYLLERDPVTAAHERDALQSSRSDVEQAVEMYAHVVDGSQRASFSSLAEEIRAYWKALEPVFHWDVKNKQARSETFLHDELLPRRTATLQIADRIAAMNEQEMDAGTAELEGVFKGLRSRLVVVLAVSLTFGVVLAAGATLYLGRLARDADTRFMDIVRAQQELKDLSARLLDIQEKERRTLSRELHDEVGQSLSAVLMEIGNLGAALPEPHPELRTHLDSIRLLTENSVKVVRNMTLLLRPSMLDDLGLVPALQWQAREVSRRTGIEVEVSADTVADDLPEEHKTCIYRVVQEALHNCTRHSGAGSVELTAVQHADRIVLTIQDDGKGFDSRTVRGMGLLGMEERVTHLGGTFQVNSKPGRGAILHIELPLPAGVIRASA